jgi:XRE family transcriptional regulator, regulator of sulfur utilization
MQTAAQALARNLKRKRLERAISLSELARLSGVSKATLSGLERGNGNPSVDTVWALAHALNASFGDLFDEDDGDVVQVGRVDEAQIVTAERGFTGRKLLNRHGRGGIEVYVLDLKRGAKRKASAHSPGVVEHVIVVSGRAEVGPDDEATVVGEGDRVSFSADRPHHYYALGGPVRLLSLTDYP